MPDMTALHSDGGWRTCYRFGPGFHPEDNYLLIVRLDGDGPLLGFAWVDAAARTDARVAEPWWCINAVAVDGRIAGQGLGRQLVAMIKDQAAAIGISSLYGLCYPSSAGFWRKQGSASATLDRGSTRTSRSVSATAPAQRSIWTASPAIISSRCPLVIPMTVSPDLALTPGPHPAQRFARRRGRLMATRVATDGVDVLIYSRC
jgi:GNAT superfamily N-acetyltransferase